MREQTVSLKKHTHQGTHTLLSAVMSHEKIYLPCSVVLLLSDVHFTRLQINKTHDNITKIPESAAG